MKILATMVAAAAATAWAGETGAGRERTVTVCVDPSGDGVEIRSVQGLASKPGIPLYRDRRGANNGREAAHNAVRPGPKQPPGVRWQLWVNPGTFSLHRHQME